MGLEALLARLEARPVTSVTSGDTCDVTENTLQNKDVTPVTLVTPETIEGKAGNILEALARPDWEAYAEGGYGPGRTVTPIAGDSWRNMQDAARAKAEGAFFEKLQYAAGLLPRPDADETSRIKEAWIREVKEAWRPFWTPEMEGTYGWRGSRKKPKRLKRRCDWGGSLARPTEARE
jgi:hypothetical protein